MEEGEEGELGLPEISPKEKDMKVMLCQGWGSRCLSSHSHGFQVAAQGGELHEGQRGPKGAFLDPGEPCLPRVG